MLAPLIFFYLNLIKLIRKRRGYKVKLLIFPYCNNNMQPFSMASYKVSALNLFFLNLIKLICKRRGYKLNYKCFLTWLNTHTHKCTGYRLNNNCFLTWLNTCWSIQAMSDNNCFLTYQKHAEKKQAIRELIVAFYHN